MDFYNHRGTGTMILLRLEIVVYLQIRGLKQSFSLEKMILFDIQANKMYTPVTTRCQEFDQFGSYSNLKI